MSRGKTQTLRTPRVLQTVDGDKAFTKRLALVSNCFVQDAVNSAACSRDCIAGVSCTVVV